jgi:glutaredoxin 3
MARVEIYTKTWCPYCGFAKAFLEDKNIRFREIDVTIDSRLEREMRERSGRRSVPQVFVGDRHIGGCDDLVAAERSGLLAEFLQVGDEEDAT